jgi:hypothetical protein
MPFGNSLGEFVFKMTSVRQTDLGGGQLRIEADFAGEVSGEAPGNHYGTLTATVGSEDPTRPNPWSYVGSTLTTSGAIVRVTGSGIAQRTGAGHNIRYRGASRYSTADPKLAALNNVIGAVESEFDAATLTLKGAACEWK